MPLHSFSPVWPLLKEHPSSSAAVDSRVAVAVSTVDLAVADSTAADSEEGDDLMVDLKEVLEDVLDSMADLVAPDLEAADLEVADLKVDSGAEDLASEAVVSEAAASTAVDLEEAVSVAVDLRVKMSETLFIL